MSLPQVNLPEKIKQLTYIILDSEYSPNARQYTHKLESGNVENI